MNFSQVWFHAAIVHTISLVLNKVGVKSTQVSYAAIPSGFLSDLHYIV